MSLVQQYLIELSALSLGGSGHHDLPKLIILPTLSDLHRHPYQHCRKAVRIGLKLYNS